MMALAHLNREDRIGLAVSIAAHVALVLLLVFRPLGGDVVMPPQRIEVTLSDNVGLVSTSPDPRRDASAQVAPVFGEEAQPQPAAAERTRETVSTVDRAIDAAVSKSSKPASKPEPQPRQPTRPPERKVEKSGGSQIGADFLEGVPGAQSTSRSSTPAAEAIGPRVQSALNGAISRQLKPHWDAPDGVDSELLVTLVRFRLNPDGSLAGAPEVVRQSGVTPANAPQKARHAELAIRAVRLAAPFNLPEEFYDGWKVVTSRFDRRLSQ